MPTRSSEYKPLLFTTTIRSPWRIKHFLNILERFNGADLTDELAQTIMGEVIRYGLYRPMKGHTDSIIKKWGGKRVSEKSPIGLTPLSDIEVQSLLRSNPQQHGEAGFTPGWPSRFATIFDFSKELGFVFYQPGNKIEFSEVGLKLARSVNIKIENNDIVVSTEDVQYEQQAFINALVKYQRNNPFVRALNENRPLVLLLQVINKINEDKSFNSTGISKLELPLLLYWKDGNADTLYKRIKKLRADFDYTPSWEVITQICRDEIMLGKDIVRTEKSIMVDYPDEFIRKMRMTGLISLRGNGRFIDINRIEQETVDHALSKYSSYKNFGSEEEYFAYAAEMDTVFAHHTTVVVSETEQEEHLNHWVDQFDWVKIRTELVSLSSRALTSDEVLKYLPAPARLEFLIAVAIKSRYPSVRVLPNYPIDDEGLPTSTAAGIGNT